MSKTPKNSFRHEEEEVPSINLPPHTPSFELLENSDLLLNTPSQKYFFNFNALGL